MALVTCHFQNSIRKVRSVPIIQPFCVHVLENILNPKNNLSSQHLPAILLLCWPHLIEKEISQHLSGLTTLTWSSVRPGHAH